VSGFPRILARERLADAKKPPPIELSHPDRVALSAIVTDRNSPQEQAAIARFLAKTNSDRRLFRWTKDPHQLLVVEASRRRGVEDPQIVLALDRR
jgi:hypothetical protein